MCTYIYMYIYIYVYVHVHMYNSAYPHTCIIHVYENHTCMYIIHMYVVVTCTIFIVLTCMYISMYLSMYIQTCIHKSYYYRYTHILPLFVSVADRVCRKSLYNFVTLNATE